MVRALRVIVIGLDDNDSFFSLIMITLKLLHVQNLCHLAVVYLYKSADLVV